MAVAVQVDGEFSFTAPVELFNGSYVTLPDPTASSYDVARDGRFLMIQTVDGLGTGQSASIVVVQNWSEEIKRRVPGR
jgi:hypothetical protein